MNLLSNDKLNNYNKLLFEINKNSVSDTNKIYLTEYNDNYNGNKVCNLYRPTQYVIKKIQDESEFWKGGKFAYDNKILKDKLIYKTTSRMNYFDKIIPNIYKNKIYYIKKTRISEYSNALYNNNVRILLFIYL